MRIKAVANGNVIEADNDAANILIDAKIYEATDEPVTATLTPPVPVPRPQAPSVPAQNSTQPTVEKKPTRKRKAR